LISTPTLALLKKIVLSTSKVWIFLKEVILKPTCIVFTHSLQGFYEYITHDFNVLNTFGCKNLHFIKSYFPLALQQRAKQGEGLGYIHAVE
jgi:hypothetical protein